jgi:hypothetical protein
VASLFSARAFVWGDVDPHGGGLGAGEPDGSAVVVLSETISYRSSFFMNVCVMILIKSFNR